ncbi:MAG: putative NUDIX family NTP pyrophosphohydrolase [Bacteroidia bacterium]|jgi:predicted NUDIX family NTP pyrophosphohydrolase
MHVLHRVRVFVYHMNQGVPSYLLLRSAQGIEGLWRPVNGNIDFSEQFETAVRREVLEDTGLTSPGSIVDLELPLRESFGDEEVVHWNYGFRVEAIPAEMHLDKRFDHHRWAQYGQAFPDFGLEGDRTAVTRLHSLLFAA